ncbi:globin domain-containing protein [Streptomyces sp. HNM0574]|uniref:globin domain-containing protein n=1 Tax=Streptomyces sp. HNM0574 TaxID=2714954 RepID=UPI00146A0C5B|nr:globin domain-containing protein [Streptomyces sp. HNM0574]NLU69554.1 flavohemoprotein [Streptomyces sp. HNM0574]
MTTTSSDNGATAGDGGGGSGDWGWFAPARPGAQQRPGAETGPEDERGGTAEPATETPDGARETPSRPVAAIRPVGERARSAQQISRAARPGSGPDAGAPQLPARGAEPGAAAPSLFSPASRTTGTPAVTGRVPEPRPQGDDEPEPEHQPVPPSGLQGLTPAGASAPAGPAPLMPRTAPALPARPGPADAPGTGAPDRAAPAAGTGARIAIAAGPAAGAGQARVSEPSRDAVLIRRSLDEIGDRSDAVTAYFYALLFVQHPTLRDLFPASMDTQRDRLFQALLTAVKYIDDLPRLTEYLTGLGRGHRKYGTRPEHYPAVGECLLGAIAQYAPESWDDATEDAWARAYTTISQVMIDAAAEDELRSPAWWEAEVVAHEQRTPDIAVLTVRPDQPYPFLAGQYTSIETPWWPRVWRHYSFASSPRSDGLLTFHVKAVPAGWVSTALVYRAKPGDVLRLGPPAGSMTVDHRRDGGLLCLGGGTGIAPIKALIEDVAQHGRARPVEVFYGARSDHDLYDLETMLELERRNPWLSLRPVVSVGPGPDHPQTLSGELPDAIRALGPWTSYDGYLSGPPGMIRSGLDALVGSGIPAGRIRHDSLDELVAGR